MKLVDLFPPGTDLCQFPIDMPPKGQVISFDNPATLKELTIGLSTVLTSLSLVFVIGRLYNNARKLSWSDGFIILALMLNITECATMIKYVKYFRHEWNTPLCWITGEFLQVQYVWEITNNFALLFGKTATLLLFNQLFTISRRMRLAIRIGMAINFVTYITSIGVLSYFAAPHSGHGWDDLAMEAVRGPTIFPFYWAVALGAVGTMLDIYIFILPLPVISRLHLSLKRRIQVMAVFLTAVLGVVASVTSLVYRVEAILGTDKSWYAGALMNCNLVEVNVAIIVASAPAFASFMRLHVMESRLLKSIRSTLGGSHDRSPQDSKISRANLHHPGGGQYALPVAMKKDHRGLGDAWLLSSTTTIEAQTMPNVPEAVYEKNGVRIIRTVEIEQTYPPQSSDGSTHSLV